MKRLRRFFRFLFRLFLTYAIISTAIVGFFAFAPAIWSPPVIRWLEEAALSKAHSKIKISHLYFSKIWPLTIRLADVDVLMTPIPVKGKIGGVDFAIATERVDRNWVRPRAILAVSLVDPKLTLELPPEEPAAKVATGSGAASRSLIIPNPSGMERPSYLDFDLAFGIYRGQIQIQGRPSLSGLKNFNFYFRIPSLRDEIWRPYLKVDGVAEARFSGVELPLPIELEMGQASVAQDAFKIENFKFSLAKLNFLGKGFYGWDGDYDLQLALKDGDVAKLPPTFLPAGRWQGLFTGSVRLQKQLETPRRISISLESQNLKGAVDLKKEDAEIQGEISAQARLKLDVGASLNMDDSSVLIDLVKTKISYGEYFHKEPGTEMSLLINADALNDAFNLRRAQIRVAHVRLDVTGDAKVGDRGRVQAVLLPTTISGLEKLIPPLRRSPVQGVVSGEFSGQGALDDLRDWTFELKRLNIGGLRGRVDWGRGAITLQGPVTGQLALRGQMKGGAEFESGGWDFTGDLSDLDIKMGDKFHKPAGWNLKTTTTGRILGNQVMVEKLRLVGDGGDIQGKGSLTWNKNDVPLSFTVNFSPLKINSWLRVAPMEHLKAAGELSGQVGLNGKWIEAEGLATSPLQLNAQLVLKDGEVVYVPPAPDAAKKEKAAATSGTEIVEPLLPNWPVVRTAKVGLDSGFKRLVLGDLQLAGVTHVGQWLGGQWKGTASVENLFGGTAQISRMTVDPVASPPGFDLQVAFQSLHADKVVEWIKPKLKGYMEGRISGEVAALGAIPLAEVGYSQTKAEGTINISQGILKTVNLDAMINKELGKFGISSAQVKNSPMAFAASMQFLFQDSQLNLEKFKMVTARQDELGLRGLIDLNLQADLSGTIALANVRLSGAVAKANADNQGRLVVPMQLKGSLLSPNFSITDATIASMLTKTLEVEAKKALQDLGKDGGEKLKQDLKKRLNKVFGK